MRKTPKCKNCGGFHYTYQCWSKPKIPHISHSKPSSKRSGASERQRLIKQLDTLTSLYIRQKGIDRNGFNTCYTCGARYHWKEMDCGHYIKRRYLHTRWNLTNVLVQCVICNRTLGGNYKVYEPKIRAELGTDEVQKLWDLAYKTDKISTIELEQMIEDMKIKLKELKE